MYTPQERVQVILRNATDQQLIEVYMTAYDKAQPGDTHAHMGAATVRGWAEAELERRDNLHLLADALGACRRCWATLDLGFCTWCDHETN